MELKRIDIDSDELHVSPAQTQNPDEYVTEACFPIE